MEGLFPSQGRLIFGAPLDGRSEVPPVRTPGLGMVQVTFTPDRRRVEVRLAVQGLDRVTMAHIHLGAPGANGPVVLWLFRNPQGLDARRRTTLTNGSFTASALEGPLKGQPLTALLREVERGNAYVNVHTAAHPQGEIRGQLQRV